MAGTFTHFLVCDVAKRKRTDIGSELWQLLNKYSEFLFLGAASPDLPYLSFKTGGVNWADVMHYEKTNGNVSSGHEVLKSVWQRKSAVNEVQLVWLLGYVSHLVTDATIHPIVQAIVGPYEQNKEEHRICEINQDCLLFNDYKNNDIYYAEFSSILKLCQQSEHLDELMEFWKNQMSVNYHDKGEEPHPSIWFNTYTKAIDIAEGGSYAVALFRHIGLGTSYTYRPKVEILSDYPDYYKRYYQEVNLPGGSLASFREEGFKRAVSNVMNAWKRLYSGLRSEIVVAEIVRNWNLDTGVDINSPIAETTYWV